MATQTIQQTVRLHRRDDPQWERVVFAELLIPETPNVYNDYWTREAIREAAYEFMRQGFGVDVDHDNIDRTDSGLYLVETFIARAGDPDFIEGSWVIAMRVADDALWQRVLDGELNGFSYEALIESFDAEFTIEDDGIRQGTTEPVLDGDGHVHKFLVVVGPDNRPTSGGTDEVDGHSHTISTHTVTDETNGHRHRYQIIQGKGGK